MSKHVHAESMMLYAQDAMETDKPWERWEYFSSATNTWRQCVEQTPSWYTDRSYRRKQDTIIVNGREIPAPIRNKLMYGQKYFHADIYEPDFCGFREWDNDGPDNTLLKRGLIHLDKASAIAHAKALLNLGEDDE